ncbi:flagellar protein FliS [Paenibacillus physcomitrellae]|uniref:Flagellar protein FliS n=1 Tax=Paenibacillus physcomitrellae TaxID=1619311 RepID=A0ABQ1GH61_9BACL|nr:flagellar export chaperone FliS [Paenibacillus physcomitrellae]GGA43626.1 flagellar protein FliS [Paenibacillus physcomitrellae]
MIKSPYEKYRQSSVQTSSPASLLIMLYDGAIRFTKASIEGLNNNDLNSFKLHVGKVQNIVTELMSTLNPSIGVSKNLYALYEYMGHLLASANIQNNSEPLEEVLGYLTDLRETWSEALKTTGGAV